jgi:hypothetical protein
MASVMAVKPELKLRSVALLAGSVRGTELSCRIGRSLLDLPIENDRTVLEAWHDEIEALGKRRPASVQVVVDSASAAPKPDRRRGPAASQIIVDTEEFRGTGGVLRDLSRGLDPDDFVLVCNAAQILIEPLESLYDRLRAIGGDVGLIACEDGMPSSVLLVRVGVLEGIRDEGFVDFKEQVLPKLVATHEIGVLKRAISPGLPIRTAEGYIDGLFAHHRLLRGQTVEDPFAEEWSPLFAIIEPGSQVDPSATIHDSVVLEGGRVDRGAVVVRSVVCPGGVVHRGQTVVDQVVAREESARDRRRP